MRRCLFLAILSVALASADDLDKVPLRKDETETISLPDGRCRLGNVIIDGKRRAIEMHGEVNMQEGLVELFACAPGGKTHESVLVLDARPLHLQLALLALGLNPGRNPGVPRETGDQRKPGDMVEIRVQWLAGDEKREVRAEETIYNQAQGRAMRQTDWVFLGSQVGEGVFAADETGSLITTYHDPLAVIENPLDTVNDDTLYFANSSVVPPVGTKVIVTISAVERKS